MENTLANAEDASMIMITSAQWYLNALLESWRGRTAQRCLRVAAAHLPPIVREYSMTNGRSRGFGQSDLARRIIFAPAPTTRAGLFIFLHECAHFVLHQNRANLIDIDYEIEEREADEWASARMTEAQIEIDLPTQRLQARAAHASHRSDR